MISRKNLWIKILFSALNILAFSTVIYCLCYKFPVGCAAAALAGTLNFICFRFYTGYIYKKLEQQLTGNASVSPDFSDNVNEQLLTLTRSAAILSDENQMLKTELDLCKCQLSTAPLFYHCPLTSAMPINLNKFFTSYFKEQADVFQKIRIKASIQTDNTPSDILLSPSALTLVCNNLLDNSLKFTPEGGTVLVTLTRSGNNALIIWKNSGEGISESDAEKVFQLNFTGTTIGHGTGLGLTQTAAIISDYGGHIWAKSSKGKGFAIYIELPPVKNDSE